MAGVFRNGGNDHGVFQVKDSLQARFQLDEMLERCTDGDVDETLLPGLLDQAIDLRYGQSEQLGYAGLGELVHII